MENICTIFRQVFILSKRHPDQVYTMKGISLLCFTLILLIIPCVLAEEYPNISVWEVTNVTQISDSGPIAGDPDIYKQIVFAQVSNTSIILGINLSDEKSENQSILITGDVFPSHKFSASDSDGVDYIGTIGDINHSLLYIIPPSNQDLTRYTILNLTLVQSNLDEPSKGVIFNSADVLNPFMAVVSSGIDEEKKKSQQSEDAWLPGNSLYKDNPAINCKDKKCGCEGETCTCTGSDCIGGGKDADWSKNGYSCTGFDCLLICEDGKDCKLGTNS